MNPKEYAHKKLASIELPLCEDEDCQPTAVHPGPTGPRTEAGKRRSSLNATKHSLCGKIHITTPEEAAIFNKHCENLIEAFAPIGALEIELAQDIAENRWRLKRARAIESSIFAQGHRDHVDDMQSGHPDVDAALAEGQTWIQEAKNIQLLTLYETRIRRAVERTTAELKALQIERKAAYVEARHQAIRLARVAEDDGVDYNPTPDFSPARDYGEFVFSSSEIARVIDRRFRLDRSLYIGTPDPRPSNYRDAA